VLFEDYTKFTKFRKRLSTITFERTPITDGLNIAHEILNEIDEENIKQSTEEKVIQAAFSMAGMPYIDNPEDRERLFLDNPETYDSVLKKYWIADQAMNFRMGGTAYTSKPSEVEIERGTPKKSGALLYIVLALGGLASAAAGILLGDIDGDSVSGKDELLIYHTNPLKHDPALFGDARALAMHKSEYPLRAPYVIFIRW
jgi:hypothetical protein